MADMMGALLRAFGARQGETAAKDVLGGSPGSVANTVNSNSRAAYLRYVEDEQVAGREPLPMPQWLAQQRRPVQ